MVWKKVINVDSGTADLFGGDDMDKVSDLFSDVDVDDITINSDWTFRSGKLNIRNPANTFNYNIVAGAISAARTLNLPVITASDTLAVLGLAQTLTNKTIDATCTVNSAALASDVVTEGAANSFGDFDNSFKDNRIRIWNPADTFRTTVVGGAVTADRNASIPALSADDSFAMLNQAQTLKNKTISGGYNNTDGNFLEYIGIENPYAKTPNAATVVRPGMFFATGSTSSIGILNAGITSVTAGTAASNKSTTEGFGFDYPTTAVANANAGLRWTTTGFRREWGAYMILRVAFSSTSDIRVFIGFSSDTAEIAGETTLNNFSGCGIGKRAADTNWFTMRNDGDATEDRVDTGVAFATGAVTIEMALNATNFRCRLGSAEQTAQTTEIPASATNLAPHVEIETGAGAADKTITIYPIYARSGAV